MLDKNAKRCGGVGSAGYSFCNPSVQVGRGCHLASVRAEWVRSDVIHFTGEIGPLTLAAKPAIVRCSGLLVEALHAGNLVAHHVAQVSS